MSNAVRVFISYARGDDEAFVRRLYRDLTNAGLDLWFDRLSMPSRQLTFHQEIRDAVARSDRLLLVIGPKAAVSDYVTQEWRFALEMGKCVNPIVRLNGLRNDGRDLDAYGLIPEELKLIHSEDFRDDSQYAEHLANLIRQLSDPAPPLGKLVAVPNLPEHYRAQLDRLKALREALLIDLQRPVVVSGVSAHVGVHGMGGIGKSVLAMALARDLEVRRAFPDGVFWIRVGQQPDLSELQRVVVKELGGDTMFNQPHEGKERLRELLEHRAALLILDDVWKNTDADAFDVVGTRSKLLMTTRDAGLVTTLTGTGYQVQLPSEAEALNLLATAAKIPMDLLPPLAREVVAECGRLPLALALCGGMVQAGTPWQDLLEGFREHDLEYVANDRVLEEQHRSIWRAMEMSIRVLSDEQRLRFTELAVFSSGARVPEAAILTLWAHTGGLKARNARQVLIEFKKRSLILLDHPAGTTEPGGATMSVHDLLHDFAVQLAEEQFGALKLLHEQLLNSYRKICPDGWHSGPNEGYFFQSLISHLIEVQGWDELKETLTDLYFIEAKCKAGLVYDLVADYGRAEWVWPGQEVEHEKEEERQKRIKVYVDQLIAHAQDPDINPLPEPPPLVEVHNSEPEGDRKREWTPLECVQAWKHFVNTHIKQLADGEEPIFQIAWNSVGTGPVAEQMAELEREGMGLSRQWLRLRNRPTYNQFPDCLKVLEGHTGGIVSVSLTPDGKQAVSGSEDKTLRVWDLNTGACVEILEGHKDSVRSVSLTPDGRQTVSGSYDKTLRVWDIDTGKCQQVLEGHKDRIISVSLTPDGKQAVSGSSDRTLRVWDLKTGTCVQILEGHKDDVRSVSLTPDGKCAVSGSTDKTLRVWDLKTGACVQVLEGHKDVVDSVSLTPDGKYAVSGSWDKTLRAWDLTTGACLRVLVGHTRDITSVSLTPDGMRAVSVGADKTLRVWDLGTGECVQVSIGHTHEVYSVSVTADGKQAISVSYDKTLRVWDLNAGKCEQLLERHIDEVSSVSLTPDGRQAVSGSLDTTLRVWNLNTGICLRVLEGHTGWISSVSLTPDGRQVVSGSFDNRLRVWDLNTGACLKVLEGHKDAVRSVSLTHDGMRAVSGSSDSTLRVWDLSTGECVQILEGHTSCVASVSLTPDGRQVVSGSSDSTLRVWDLDTGKCQHVLEGHKDLVTSVSLTPDGKYAVSGSWDKTLRVWNLNRGICVRVLEGHTGFVNSISVTDNGQLVASISNDFTIRTWNIDSGDQLALCRFNGHGNTIQVYCHSLFCDCGSMLSRFDMVHFDLGIPRITAERIWSRVSTFQDDSLAAVCPLCGDRFTVRDEWIGNDIDCPNLNCNKKLTLNSSILGENDDSYIGQLREGLQRSRDRRRKEDLLSHLTTLIFLLKRHGNMDEARALETEKDGLKGEIESAMIFAEEMQVLRSNALECYQDGDYAGAELLLLKLLKNRFEIPGTRCHLARLYIVTGRDVEAVLQVELAWRERMGAPSYVIARILWFKFLFDLLDGSSPTASIGKFKTVFQSLTSFVSWDMARLLNHVKTRLSVENHSFLSALVAALGHHVLVAGLDRFEIWRNTPPQPMD